MTSFNTGLSWEVKSYYYPSGDIGGVIIFTNTSASDLWILMEADVTGSYVGPGHQERGRLQRNGSILSTDKNWLGAPPEQKAFWHPLITLPSPSLAISESDLRERTFYPGEYLGFRGFAGTGSRFTVLEIKKAR